jgi:hypothetical protein
MGFCGDYRRKIDVTEGIFINLDTTQDIAQDITQNQ